VVLKTSNKEEKINSVLSTLKNLLLGGRMEIKDAGIEFEPANSPKGPIFNKGVGSIIVEFNTSSQIAQDSIYVDKEGNHVKVVDFNYNNLRDVSFVSFPKTDKVVQVLHVDEFRKKYTHVASESIFTDPNHF